MFAVTRADSQAVASIEQAFIKGQPLLLENWSTILDGLLYSVIQHKTTTLGADSEEGMCQQMVLAAFWWPK